jgi:cbb3-type cytochrome oxidase cytochrome c subunit
VAELQPSERYPDPPAPKLVKGFQLIKDMGCYGCHEISGFDGPDKRIGPDLRLEPPYSSAALGLVAGGGLTPQQQTWAEELAHQPSNDRVRRSLTGSLLAQEELPGDPTTTKKLIDLLDELDTPGKLRRVGPSLRYVASKDTFEFLYSWIRKPTDFRPTTKMPQFFDLHDHLGGDSLKESQRYEPIEVRTAVEYLLANSQPFEYIPSPESVTAEPSVERGKQLFEIRGCLACHQEADFPQGTMTQGPDLSRIGAKLAHRGDPDGAKWLYTWLRNPDQYHARTFMPNLLLEPLPGPDGTLTDPAADITAYLLTATQDWKPKNIPSRDLNDEEKSALHDLALDHLQTVFTRRQSEKYLKEGIPEERRSELKGDEIELVGPMSIDKQMQFVGRRTISKYGCYGCHDIPGFEAAKPIGTGLADWGRKAPDRLAFEQIVEYLKHGHGKPGRLEPHTSGDITDPEIEEADVGQYGTTHFNFEDFDPSTGYFMEKLFGHQREGFIWQKLRQPRSYDYEKTQNKGYNERLRMPRFTALDDVQREAIITFVLGLVSEPPTLPYVYKGTPKRDAIVQGLEVIEKFNCTGCHAFAMDRWDLAYAPDDFPDAPNIPDYAFLQVHFSPEQIEKSLETDPAGLLHATLVGKPAVNEDGTTLRLDEDGAPIEADDTETPAYYSFAPWQSVLLNGQARQAGVQNLLVPESRITKRYPAKGGFLADLAYPAVVKVEKAVNPAAKAEEAWGWLPPPLVGEGIKVQSAWLYDFLLDPYPIRPAVMLRMPKFNMSPDDARKVVNYFAAIDGADYPYDFDPRTRASHLAAAAAQHPNRLDDAMKIVVDNNYCVKCHLVGDFDPEGSERAKAPQMDRVFERVRPQWMMDWIANPKRLLPYTGMPTNIPYDNGVSQELYKGTPDQQLNAVVDLLMNFDRYTESKTSIKTLVKPAPPAAAATDSAPSGAPAGGPAQ